MPCAPSRGPFAGFRHAACRELKSSRSRPRLIPAWGKEVGEPPCRPLNFAAKSARGSPRPRLAEDAAPRHRGNRLSAAADWAVTRGAGWGRDAAEAAGTRACQSRRSGAADSIAGPAARREAARAGQARPRAGPEARRGCRAVRGYGPGSSGVTGAGETGALPLLQRSSPTPGARLSILESALRLPDSQVLSAKAREAASQPLPLAAAATAADRRLPLPPHPGLGAGGGGAGAFSALLSATCGGRCMPG